jgi:soluble lytic murein transglycosylase-like protein
MRWIAVSALLTFPALAAELVTLSSGFTIQAEKLERAGAVVRIHTANGLMELPAEQVVSVEKIEAIAPVVQSPSAPSAAPIAAPVVEPSPATPRELVEHHAKKAGLPPELVRSLASAESAFNQKAVSNKGAIGIMQLMPQTAASLAVDPHQADQNVEGGVRYLKELLAKYDGDVAKALAAYNAGPGAVEKYKGIPPYRETVQYVDRVIRRYLKEKPEAAVGGGSK